MLAFGFLAPLPALCLSWSTKYGSLVGLFFVSRRFAHSVPFRLLTNSSISGVDPMPLLSRPPSHTKLGKRGSPKPDVALNLILNKYFFLCDFYYVVDDYCCVGGCNDLT